MRLVTRIDDGTLQRRFQADLLLEEIRALGQLKPGVRSSVLGPHLSRAGEDLPRDEEGREMSNDLTECEVTA